MQLIMVFSNMIIPLTFALILIYGYSKNVDLYETFIEGAKDGLTTVLNIMPTLLGLMVSVGMLRASGALDMVSRSLAPFVERIGFPSEALPLTFMRLVSSSASAGLLLDIFKNYGADSFLGRFVSVMMSSTETVFYTLSLYFMSVKITKTRYTLAGALLANFAGVVASLFITEFIFGRY